ncbi:MAG: 3-deoxy-D-manno-octulosonic acid transferase [Thermodesulfobacteriota bacterium]|nr:3-deoxy-D-manno-octulosonic acid transferase [Thermodesulfobacteriota bacterium]
MMHPLYSLYTLAGTVVLLLIYPLVRLFPGLIERYGGGLDQRLGRYPKSVRQQSGTPRIWIHAASVGEVRVAAAMIAAFRQIMPGCAVILSTMTPRGRAFAEETVGDEAACIYVPLDIIFSVNKAFDQLQPDAFVVLETEIWPHLFLQAKKRGVVTAILNGRLSLRNHKGYRRLKPLFRLVLSQVDILSMINSSDAQRILALGAPPERVFVNGNAKYDALNGIADERIRVRVRQRFHLAAGQPVFVAGSTRQNEEAEIAAAFQKICKAFPETLLIVAPRHPERTASVVELLKTHGLFSRLLTEMDAGNDNDHAPQVVVIDTMGELLEIYSIASVVFCGGSLVPLGGQNLLEPAAWGVPVLFGPFMDDFPEAREMLEATGGGLEVKNSDDLVHQVIDLLANPEKARIIGNAARAAVQANARAAEKHVRLVCDRLISVHP